MRSYGIDEEEINTPIKPFSLIEKDSNLNKFNKSLKEKESYADNEVNMKIKFLE
jgi:hypothetical protein